MNKVSKIAYITIIVVYFIFQIVFIISSIFILTGNMVFENELFLMLFGSAFLIINLFIIYYCLFFNQCYKMIKEGYNEDGIIIANKNGRIIYINKAYATMAGIKIRNLLGQNILILKKKYYQSKYYDKLWEQILSDGFWEGHIVDKRSSNGLVLSHKLRVKSFTDKVFRQRFYIFIHSHLQDLDTIKRTGDDFEELVENKLPSLIDCYKKIEALINNKVSYFVVIHSKLVDHLKVESLLGLYEIQNLAFQYCEKVKEHYKANASIFKYDTYSLITVLTVKEPIEETQRYFECFRNLILVNNDFIRPRINHGYTIYPIDDTDPMNLVSKAGLAVDHIRQVRNEYWGRYDESLKKINDEQMELAFELPYALENREFKIYYQPQVNAKDNKIVGFEALTRWYSHKFGIVNPNLFMPLLQKNAYQRDFDLYVINQVFSDYKKIVETHKNITISINVEYYSLQSETFYFLLVDAIRIHNINPRDFVFELTEQEYIIDMDSLQENVKKIKDLGFSVSLDDFGTGYNSLASFVLPIDEIKIESAFFKKEMNEKDYNIVKAILAFGKGLGLRVVAEGIEFEQHKEFLLEQESLIIMQGFLFAKPMGLEEILHFKLKKS